MWYSEGKRGRVRARKEGGRGREGVEVRSNQYLKVVCLGYGHPFLLPVLSWRRWWIRFCCVFVYSSYLLCISEDSWSCGYSVGV